MKTTRHFNPSISEDALRILNSKQGDFLGDEVQGPVGVILIKRFNNICRAASAANATTATAFTTPTDKDFYLTAATLSVIKDATATSTRSSLRVTIEGVAIDLLRISNFTLTAQNGSVSQNWPDGIKIDRGTNIQAVNTTNVANVTTEVTIQGYTVETTR